MQYAKVQCAFVRSAAFREADMAARGAWLTITAYCADQENGGRIVACGSWTDRQWLSRADCMRDDVDHLVRSELGRWEGADLVLVGYDQVAEASFHAVAEVNRRKALDRWAKTRGDAAGTAAGKGDECRPQADQMPPALPQHGSGMPPASVSDANQPTNQPTTERHTRAAAAAAGAARPASGAAPGATATAAKINPDANARIRALLGKAHMPATPQAAAEWEGFLRDHEIKREGAFASLLAFCKPLGVLYERHVTVEMLDAWRAQAAS